MHRPSLDSTIPGKPLLKPWYRLRIDDNRALFQYGDNVMVFRGRAVAGLFPQLLPLLDGTRDLDALRAHFGDRYDAVANALGELHRRDLLSDGTDVSGDVTPSVAASVHLSAADPGRALSPRDALERLRRSSVALFGDSAMSTMLRNALLASGVGCVNAASNFEALGQSDVAVIATHARDVDTLQRWNEAALKSGAAWLPILPYDGAKRIVGPLYVPPQTACHHCFLTRRHANVEYPDEFWALAAIPAPFPAPAAFDLMASGVAAALLTRWLVAGDGTVPGQYYVIEPTGEMALTKHRLYRVPRCSACGAQRGSGAPAPWARR